MSPDWMEEREARRPKDIPEGTWALAYLVSFRGYWPVVESVARAMMGSPESYPHHFTTPVHAEKKEP